MARVAATTEKTNGRKSAAAKSGTSAKMPPRSKAVTSESRRPIKLPKVAKVAKSTKTGKPAASKSLAASGAVPSELAPGESLAIVSGAVGGSTVIPKQKLVRDSFTMPRADFDLVDVLKARALVFQRPAKKSELLRAGLHALAALTDTQLRHSLDALTPLKAGRPKNPG